MSGESRTADRNLDHKRKIVQQIAEKLGLTFIRVDARGHRIFRFSHNVNGAGPREGMRINNQQDVPTGEEAEVFPPEDEAKVQAEQIQRRRIAESVRGLFGKSRER